MAKQPDKILIIDLESTCWDTSIPSTMESEIIEIGVCLLDVKSGEILNNQGILVQPRNSEVSSFCTQLTSITSEMLNKDGVSFETACDKFKIDYNAPHLVWASYGAYDLKMFNEQCKKFGIDYPLSNKHINVKTKFTEIQHLKKGVGMARALQMLNIPLEGTHHRGIDDAKNIAKILNRILKALV